MRDRFPFCVSNPNSVYLDSAATSQTLDTVIQDTNDFLTNHKSNAHRSGHSMGAWVDNQYWLAKEKIGNWLNVSNYEDRIIFNSGATQGLYDAIQLATTGNNDFSVFIGGDFHHSLALPFHNTDYNQLHYIDINSTGTLNSFHLDQLLREDTSKTKIIAVTAVGNVAGAIHDLERIRELARDYNAITIIDACQSMGKIQHNYHGFDFVAWSWHKLYGPQGLGCLMIDPKWLDSTPIRPGGGSVTHVSYNDQSYLTNATRFESGTPNLQAICSLPRLLDFLTDYQNDIIAHDKMLTTYANDLFSETRAYRSNTGLISINPSIGSVEDVTLLLDANNIMVRGGNLCAEPLVSNISANKGVLRLSWGAYTTKQELELAYNKIEEAYGRISKFI